MRKVLVATLFILAMSPLRGVAETPSLDSDTEARLYGAITKISITYLDKAHHPKGPDDQGHGVFITNDGTILTAAHVVLPSQEAIGDADAYEITVQSWDPASETWHHVGDPISSNDLLSSLVTNQHLNIAECGPGKSGDAMPCLTTEPNLSVDYAYLKTKSQSPFYIDLFGPRDTLTRDIFEHSPWFGWVVADFDFHGRPDIATVKPFSTTDHSLFRTNDNKEFHRGISGSPLVIVQQTPYVSQLSFFVGGIAARNFARPYRDVSVVLPQEFEVDANRALPPNIPNGVPFSCSGAAQPYPYPLLMNYAAFIRTGSIHSFDLLTACLERYTTWSKTLGALNLIKDHPDLIKQVGNLLRGVPDAGDSVAVFVAGARKNPAASNATVSFLDLSYESGIDPVVLLTLAKQLSQAPNCEICAKADTTLQSYSLDTVLTVTKVVRNGNISPNSFNNLLKVDAGKRLVYHELSSAKKLDEKQ